MSDGPNGTPAVDAPPIPAPRKIARVRPVLLGLVILLSGIAIGAGGVLLIAPKKILPPFMEPGLSAKFITERMTSDLQLSPAQAAEVQRIVKERMQALDRIREETSPRVNAELRQMKDELSKVLTPEQARAWKERLDKFRQMGPPRWSPPGGPGPQGTPGQPPGGYSPWPGDHSSGGKGDQHRGWWEKDGEGKGEGWHKRFGEGDWKKPPPPGDDREGNRARAKAAKGQ